MFTALQQAFGASVVLDGSLSTVDPSTVDAIVAVIGEQPYAEYEGDRSDLSLATVDTADTGIFSKYSGVAAPLIVVMYSGRPLIITDQLAKSNAFMAAFLPGSAAEGIVDLLFGDAKPTATLSMSWPASMAQIPINIGDPGYDSTNPPLFPVGYGLSY